MQPDTLLQGQRVLNPERWVDNYADPLFAFTLLRVKDRQQAEDIVQSTFLSAWKARLGYTGEASEKNWLFTICKNKIIDYYRKRNTNSNVLAGLDEENYFDSSGHWTKEAMPRSWGDAYEHPGEKTEFYKILASCSAKLKAVQQQVFVLKYMEDISSEEICSVLNITSGNYWILIHRAKLQLRACLEKNWLHIK